MLYISEERKRVSVGDKIQCVSKGISSTLLHLTSVLYFIICLSNDHHLMT